MTRGREVPWDGRGQAIPTLVGEVPDVECSCGTAAVCSCGTTTITRAPARDLVGETRRAFAHFLAGVTVHEEHVPVLTVDDAPFKNGVVVTIKARLSPAAVDRLRTLVDRLVR